MYTVTYKEKFKYNVNEIVNLDKQHFSKNVPLSLLRWKHLFKVLFISNWNYKQQIQQVSHSRMPLPPPTDKDWGNIGILYGGGKESLLTLCMLREMTNETLHIIMMGRQDETNWLVQRLRLMMKAGLKNIKLHMALVNKNKDRTWSQITGCLPICHKYKIGKIFFGAEGDYHAFNTKTKEVSQYSTCGVSMNKFASAAMQEAGYPIEFTSLVYPLSAWNSMYILKERYPQYAKHVMCYLPNWSGQRKFARRKSGSSVKIIRSALYADSMNFNIDNRQRFLIDVLTPRLFSKQEYLDDYHNHISYIPYSLEAMHSMHRLGILPKYAKRCDWVEMPYSNFKQHLDDAFAGAWDIFVEHSLKQPGVVDGIYPNVTLDSVNEVTNLMTKSLENFEVI